jgi:hypothetical protein
VFAVLAIPITKSHNCKKRAKEEERREEGGRDEGEY